MLSIFKKVSAFCGTTGGACAAVLLAFTLIPGSFGASATTTGMLDETGRVYREFKDTENEFSVVLNCDGKRTIWSVTRGDQVSDVLDDAGVTLGELDLVDPPARDYLEKGDSIVVTRRKLVTREEKVELPNKVVEKPTSLLKEGVRRTLVEGKPGLCVKTYAQLHENGKPAEPEYETGKEVVTAPVDSEVLVGTPGAPISPLEFDVALDENGVPVSCRNVLRGRSAAGYSAKAGAKTASGRPAIVGHVAVNPRVIPYGTKLYIRSRDGSFVYGFAIAADTGTALTQGIVDLDLFYGSYMESALNGIRTVDIYIL